MPRITKIVVLLLMLGGALLAQPGRTLKLLDRLSTADSDTARIPLLNALAQIKIDELDIGAAERFADSARLLLDVQMKSQNRKSPLVPRLRTFEAEYLSNDGRLAEMKGNYGKAFQSFERAERIYSELNNFSGRAGIWVLKGHAFMSLEDDAAALELFKRAEEYFEKAGMMRELGFVLDAEGQALSFLEKNTEALSHYSRCQKLAGQIGDTTLLIVALNNSGPLYNSMNLPEKALANYHTARALCEVRKDRVTRASVFTSIGYSFLGKQNRDSATYYFQKALTEHEQLRLPAEMIIDMETLADIYEKEGQVKQSEAFYLRALKLSEELQEWTGMMVSNLALSKIYAAGGKWMLATKHLKAWARWRDSLDSRDLKVGSDRKRLLAEFESRENETRLKNEKNEAVAAAENERQATILFTCAALLLLAAVFAIHIYRGFLQYKRISNTVAGQKKIIEMKQKEILDSIQYAKRIQMAHIPSEEFVRKKLEGLL